MPDIMAIAETAKRAIIAGSYDYAISVAKHILSRYPKCIEGYSLLGRAYVGKGLASKAGYTFQLVLSADPENFTGHIGLGVALRDLEDLDGALKQFEQALDIRPSSLSVRQEILRLRQLLGTSADGKIKMSRVGLARTYLNAGLYDKAIGEVEGVLGADPARLDAMVVLAQAQWLAKRWADSQETCSSTLSLSPDCLKPKLICADILYSEGLKKEALVLLEESNALDPANTMAKSLLTGEEVLGILPADAGIELPPFQIEEKRRQ